MKKTGDIRLCEDFSTGLNEALENYHHPLPLPEDIYAKLNGSIIFSHIDLSDAFLQIEVDDQSKKYLVINTHVELFQYDRLPFGTKISPSIFQEAMDKLIASLSNVICYMDDIIVYGKNKEEHDQALLALINKIQDTGLHIKLSKCKFALGEIKYLGLTINIFGFNPDELCIEALFHHLLKKNTHWNWNEACEIVFKKLKSILSSNLVLTHYNPKLEIILSSDASNKGLETCIQHLMTDILFVPLLMKLVLYNRPKNLIAKSRKKLLASFL